MDIDFNSAAWLQVVQWATARIQTLRAKNDGDLDPSATASVRGEIKAFKGLLALPATAARERQTETGD